jgi:LPXTG-motif cell wall-anchored protein
LLRGNRNEVGVEGGFTNQGYGEPAPLGSGIAVLLLAGAGYVALKKKED